MKVIPVVKGCSSTFIYPLVGPRAAFILHHCCTIVALLLTAIDGWFVEQWRSSCATQHFLSILRPHCALRSLCAMKGSWTADIPGRSMDVSIKFIHGADMQYLPTPVGELDGNIWLFCIRGKWNTMPLFSHGWHALFSLMQFSVLS